MSALGQKQTYAVQQAMSIRRLEIEQQLDFAGLLDR
jgi:hypothetical protein